MIWHLRCIFALRALAFGAWLPRIPKVKDALGLSPSVLALVLPGLAPERIDPRNHVLYDGSRAEWGFYDDLKLATG